MRGARSLRVGVGGGLRVAALRAGAGEPVVLLASPLILARSYLPLVEELSAGWDVVAIELLGSGESSRVTRRPTADEHARAALQVMEALRLRRAVVIGHSNSGLPAARLALAAPERVRALVLADVTGADGPDALARILAARALDALQEPGLTLRGLAHVLENAAVHTRAFFGEVRGTASVDLRAEAAALAVPTLVAWGRRDLTFGSARGRALRSRIAGATLALGSGAHDWIIVHPEEFAAALGAFLRQRAPPAAAAP